MFQFWIMRRTTTSFMAGLRCRSPTTNTALGDEERCGGFVHAQLFACSRRGRLSWLARSRQSGGHFHWSPQRGAVRGPPVKFMMLTQKARVREPGHALDFGPALAVDGV